MWGECEEKCFYVVRNHTVWKEILWCEIPVCLKKYKGVGENLSVLAEIPRCGEKSQCVGEISRCEKKLQCFVKYSHV